ncbi:hypothetical protein Dimus_016304 [Dionaea muscipula]
MSLTHVFFSQFPLSQYDGGQARWRNDGAWVSDSSGGDDQDNNTGNYTISNPNIAIIEQNWPVFELGVYRAAHRRVIEVSTESKGGVNSVDGDVRFRLQRPGFFLAVLGGFLRGIGMTAGRGSETVRRWSWTTVTDAVHMATPSSG